jgi:hypothetical protein
LGRHRSHAQVFADQHGHRGRLVALLLRGATLLVVAGIAAVGLSLISGVSLPGLTPPAHLPADERPTRNAEPIRVSNVDVPAETPALPLASGLRPPTAAVSTPNPSAINSTSPIRTPTAPSSSAPASTHANRPTTTPTSSSHGQAPVTPPGRTKHP